MSVAYSAVTPLQQSSNPQLTSANLAYYLTNSQHPMDRGPADYSQTDQVSAAQYQPAQESRSSNFSTSATPTSDYGLNPPSARSGSFPDYIARPGQYPEGGARYHAASNHSGSSGGMAQASSPSLPLADGRSNHHRKPTHIKSDAEAPIDPSIAASSPGYPPQGPYSPYPPQPHEMAQAYPGHPPQNWRPEWNHNYAGQQQQHGGAPHGLPGPYNAHPSPSTNVSSASSTATAGARPGQQSHPLSQVYSFVPIPGAQQHKRPRRRYEEIERMYKCGWNGCEKAYGTLNHLNAHVTMQSHGQKRTPEEFKEIRKEWKARKKEEETQRKQEEERLRQSAQSGGQVEPQNAADPVQTPSASSYSGPTRPQLPPIAYQQPPPQAGPVQGHYTTPQGGMEQMQQYGGSSLYQSYPQSPFGQGNQMYQQHPDVPSGNYQH